MDFKTQTFSVRKLWTGTLTNILVVIAVQSFMTVVAAIARAVISRRKMSAGPSSRRGRGVVTVTSAVVKTTPRRPHEPR